MKAGLIIFIRNPIIGKVKTRLAKTMGEEKACIIYQQLLDFTHQLTRNLFCDKFLYYTDFPDRNDIWENNLYQKKVQHQGNLGERMAHAFNDLFTAGYQKLIIIGSDCIELNDQIINNAFTSLENHEVVIGPSSDGGYYLLGMTSRHPELFINKQWGASFVLKHTLQDLEISKISVSILMELNDIDEEKDLPDWLR